MGRILDQVGEFGIYKFYIGNFEIGEMFCNPLRNERNPSMNIKNVNGRLFHKDFGDMNFRGGCFDLVMQIKGCDLLDAIRWIEKDFGLSEVGGASGERRIAEKPPPGVLHRPPTFHIVTRKFTAEELGWWNMYHQDLEDLKREHIYVPKEIYRNYRRLPLRKTELVFCYYYPGADKWKIYRPDASKRRSKDTPPQDWKWDTNLDFGMTIHVDKIEGKLGIVSKSRKDRLVLRKALGTDSICEVSAEDPIALREEDIVTIKRNSEIQLCVSDNDKKGKEFSWWLTEHKGFKHCNPPDEYLNYDPQLTDFADMGRYLGLDSVTNHFKLKGWI